MPSHSKWFPRSSVTLASLTITQLQHANVGNVQYLNGLFSLTPCFCANLVCSRCAPKQIFCLSNVAPNPTHLHKTLWVIFRGTKGRFWITYSLFSVNQTIYKFYLINTEDFFSSILWLQDSSLIMKGKCYPEFILGHCICLSLSRYWLESEAPLPWWYLFSFSHFSHSACVFLGNNQNCLQLFLYYAK